MNDNNSFEFFVRTGQVQALAVPFWTRPGFAIPLVRSQANSNVAYVQKVDHRQTIIGFDAFNDKVKTIELDVARKVSVGDEELFAFIDLVGRAHVGTQTSLRPIVREWVSQIDYPFIRMNFALFCDAEKVAEEAARKAVEQKAGELNDHKRACLWFVNSVVLLEVVSAFSEENRSKNKVAALHGDGVSVKINDKKLIVELPPDFVSKKSLSHSHYSKMQRMMRLAKFATGHDLDLTFRHVVRRDDHGYVRGSENFRISQLLALSRQESRISFILRLLLTEPLAGQSIIQEYKDRAAFANRAIKIVRDSITSFEVVTEQEIASILPKIVSSAYPLQKGRLLLELATYLAEFKSIALVIDDVTGRSNSAYVNDYRSLISESLSKHLSSVKRTSR